jgi:hypothetical protein
MAGIAVISSTQFQAYPPFAVSLLAHGFVVVPSVDRPFDRIGRLFYSIDRRDLTVRPLCDRSSISNFAFAFSIEIKSDGNKNHSSPKIPVPIISSSTILAIKKKQNDDDDDDEASSLSFPIRFNAVAFILTAPKHFC